MNKYKRILKEANNLKKIQSLPGNYNYDNYMLGLYNGMEMIIALFEQRNPKFINGHKIEFLHNEKNPLEGIFAGITDDELLINNGNMFAELEEIKKKQKNTLDIINTQMKNASNDIKENLRIIKITLLKGSCTVSDLKSEEDYKY